MRRVAWREEIEMEKFSDHQKWERERRAFQALELLEATYPDDPISNLERLIAADKEAHRQWRAEQKKEIDAFFDSSNEADKEAGE